MENMVKDLFNTQAHFGHTKRYRTPQLKNNIYTTVNGLDIINLDLTKDQIEKAKAFLSKFEGDILVVSSRNIVSEKDNVENIAKWKAGYISNFNFGKLKVKPQVIIVDKMAYSHNLVNEAKKAGIVLIGLCDTNTPNNLLVKTDFPIVINDDSDKAVEMLINFLIS